jgi:hypothetical protein
VPRVSSLPFLTRHERLKVAHQVEPDRHRQRVFGTRMLQQVHVQQVLVAHQVAVGPGRGVQVPQRSFIEHPEMGNEHRAQMLQVRPDQPARFLLLLLSAA